MKNLGLSEKDRRFVVRAIAQWLRNESRKELSYLQGPAYTAIGHEESIRWAQYKINANVDPEIRDRLLLIVCPSMPGMLHIAFKDSRTFFHECGCHT